MKYFYKTPFTWRMKGRARMRKGKSKPAPKLGLILRFMRWARGQYA
jgi:hypothetical protein